MKDRPIGMFDSGVGGLTVARSVIDWLPGENIIYIGDGARGPYGPRDIEEVRSFSREIIDFLLGFDVKLVVIACNSATAAALEEAQREYEIPIVGVISPGVRAAVRRSKRLCIGVMGTNCTIASGSYERALKRAEPRARIFSQACPEFVEFVERGEVTGDQITEVALGYLEPMKEAGIDTLIMGCTHYPLLEGMLHQVVGSEVSLISSADETAAEVQDILERLGWLRDRGSSGKHFFLTTGDVDKTVELGRMFLGPEVRDVIPVGLEFNEHPDLDLESASPPREKGFKLEETVVSFKVIVAGSSGGYAGPGRACSSYLLEHEDCRMALDLGSGALGNLLRYTDADTVDGLAISHLHYDHYMDIYGLLTARRFWEAQLPPLPILAPPGAAKHIGAVIHADNREAFMGCMDITDVVSGEDLEFAGFVVSAKPAQHIKNSFIYRVSVDGRTLCYSGDTDRCDALVEQAREADLFLCEATFTSEVPLKIPGHLTAKEAGETAAQAGVGRLLLTHVWPTLSGERAIEDARAAYDGPIDLAIEGLTLYVGPYPVAAT